MNEIEKKILYIEALFSNEIMQSGTGILLHCQGPEKLPRDISYATQNSIVASKAKNGPTGN